MSVFQMLKLLFIDFGPTNQKRQKERFHFATIYLEHSY